MTATTPATPSPTSLLPLSSLGATLGRVRCPRPAQIERMKDSLSRHGQLQPVIAVLRAGDLELIDGFKRRTSALAMGWTEILVRVVELDETVQWATMLLVNRGPQSMTVLEEALILRELSQLGLTQIEIGQLLSRHKTWVSRRIGLVERLHPELVEQIRLELLHPGVARRLLGLPPGNQLEIAATATKAGLGAQQTERLVAMWQRAPPELRRQILAQPRAALAPARRPPPLADPRLSRRGQRLSQMLRLCCQTISKTMTLWRPAPPAEDLLILREDFLATRAWLVHLDDTIGPFVSDGAGTASGASDAIC